MLQSYVFQMAWLEFCWVREFEVSHNAFSIFAPNTQKYISSQIEFRSSLCMSQIGLTVSNGVGLTALTKCLVPDMYKRYEAKLYSFNTLCTRVLLYMESTSIFPTIGHAAESGGDFLGYLNKFHSFDFYQASLYTIVLLFLFHFDNDVTKFISLFLTTRTRANSGW